MSSTMIPHLNSLTNPMLDSISSQIEKSVFTGPLMSNGNMAMPQGYGYTSSMHSFTWGQMEPSLSTTFMGATFEAITVALDSISDIFPLERAESLNFGWLKYYAKTADLMPRAPLAPPHLISTGKVTYGKTLSHFNIGFEMENGFAATDLGQQMFGYNMLIVSAATLKKVNELRIEAIMNCYETAKRVQAYMGFNATSISEVLRNEISVFAAVQKDKNIQTAFASLVSSMKTSYANARNNVVPSTIIMPLKMDRFIALSNQTNFDAGIVGQETRNNAMSGFPFQKSFAGMDIRMMVEYADDTRNEITNPLGMTVQIGDMFALDQVGAPSCENNEKYTSDSMTRWVIDMNANDGEFRPVTLMSALKHCRRFDKHGALDHAHQKLAEQMNSGGMGISPFTVSNGCPDMFLCRDSTSGSSNYRVAKYFGDMERIYNTYEFMDAFASTGSHKVKKMIGDQYMADIREGERLMDEISGYHLNYDQVVQLVSNFVPYWDGKTARGGPLPISGRKEACATAIAGYKCAGLGNFVGLRTIALWGNDLLKAARQIVSDPRLQTVSTPLSELQEAEYVANAQRTIEIVKIASAYDRAIMELYKSLIDKFPNNFLFDSKNLPSVWKTDDNVCNSINMFGVSVLDKASKFPVVVSRQQSAVTRTQRKFSDAQINDIEDSLTSAPYNWSRRDAATFVGILSSIVDSPHVQTFVDDVSGFHTKYVNKFGRVYAQTTNKDGSSRSSSFSDFFTNEVVARDAKGAGVLKNILRVVLDDGVPSSVITPDNIDNMISNMAKGNITKPVHSSARPSMKSQIDYDGVTELDRSDRLVSIMGFTFSDETITDCVKRSGSSGQRVLVADTSYIAHLGEFYDGLSAKKDPIVRKDLEEAFKLTTLSSLKSTLTFKDPTFSRFKNLSGKSQDSGQEYRPPEETWRSIGDFVKVVKSGELVWNAPLVDAWKHVVNSSGKCCITRSIGLLYLLETISLQSLTTWVVCNFRVPFAILNFRPFKRYATSTLVMLRPGRETGVALYGNVDYEQGSNVQIKYQSFHFSMNLGVVIYAPENIFLVNHALVNAYKTGENLQYFEERDFNVVDTNINCNTSKSVFAAMVPYRSTNGINDDLLYVSNPCDISGTWDDSYTVRLNNRNANSNDPSLVKPHYPSAAYYNTVWGFNQIHCYSGISGDYNDPSLHFNRVCWQTTQRLADGRYVRGTCHFGDSLCFDGCKKRRVVPDGTITSEGFPAEIDRRSYV